MSSTIDPGNAACTIGASKTLFDQWSANLLALGITLDATLQARLKAICFATTTAVAQAITSAGGLDQGSGGGGITPSEHQDLDTLTHVLAQPLFKEMAYDVDGNLERVTAWADSGHTVKIRETIFDYTGSVLTSVTTTQYSGGTPTGSLTKTFTYDIDGNVTNVDYT